MELIKRLEDILSKKGINQKELSEKANIAELSISRIMTGKTKPSLDSLEKIAKALNVELWQLFTNELHKKDLTALVDYKGELFKAKTLEELEEIVKKLKFIEKKSAE